MKFLTRFTLKLTLFAYLARAEIPCTPDFGAIDLTNVQISTTGEISQNGIVFGPYDYVVDGDKRLGCVCKVKKCVRKCCPDGEFLINSTACESTMKPFDVSSQSRNPETPSIGNFYIIHGNRCTPGKDRSLLEPDEFTLEPDGKLLVSLNNKHYEQDEYCLDYILDDEEDAKALVCAKSQTATTINVIGMIVSMPFLLATFIVYAIIPDRNMHAKSLMCYVISLFGAYLLLVNIQFHSMDIDGSNAACITIGILCLFLFMVSFFWINVMSIDIWWTFSGLRGLTGSRREKERKRFMIYNGYAWGVPLIIAIVVTSLTLSEDIDGYVWYNPGIGDGQCWITEGFPTLLYFYGPIALLITCNIVLFATTSWKIRQVQQETAVLRKDDNKKHNYENDKQRYYLYLKLMLAMGTNWSMEIISWAVEWQVGPTPAVWYITDFCNACYGVFIFFIFVFKRKIWMLLKRRYYTFMGKPHLARSMATQESSSPRTTTTASTLHYSRAPTVQYTANNSNVTID